jgi:acetyl/propionyl-CoA carboxylase alpha subunit
MEIKNEPYRISVNDEYHLDVRPEEAAQLDVVPDGPEHFHVLSEGRSFRSELLKADYAAHTFTFRIDGRRYTVRIADFYARLVQQLGMSAGGGHRANIVKAPMPGLVLRVLVQPGQSVQKGDALLILEAMKMENVIKAAGEGVVRSVKVQSGEAVEKGATLVELE